MQSQAEYRKIMEQPVTLTLTRAEMQMVSRAMATLESTYWNSGKPFPGHAGASSIVDKLRTQCPECVSRTYSED